MTIMLDAFLIINALPLSFCKNVSPTFSMVHLLHRLYGVDAPTTTASATTTTTSFLFNWLIY